VSEHYLWAVEWDGKHWPYPTEDEARRQLFMAQLDVDAHLAHWNGQTWEVQA
jgi:hypothetical protein